MLDPISSHQDRYDLSQNLYCQGYIDNSTGHYVGYWQYFFDAPGEKIFSEGNFYNDQQTGLWKIYNLDGSLHKTIIFI